MTHVETAAPPSDTSGSEQTGPARRPGVSWTAVLVFVVIAYGLAWLVALPLWLHDGLRNPLISPLGFAMMATPAIGALAATRFVLRPAHPARFLGLVPLRPWRRTVTYAALGFLGVQVLGVLAVLLAGALGVARVEFGATTWSTLATIPLISLLIAVPALGEELGWRGFLLPALRPLGTWPALGLSGVIWGLWHAPLILLGYNYGLTSALGLVFMSVTTVLIGGIFGWLRMRSASVWPSTFAHGALNASSGLLLAALVPGAASVTPSLLGWPGWCLLAVTIAVLAALGSYRWARSTTTNAA